MIKLSTYFDKVYVLNLVTRKDRKEKMTQRLLKMFPEDLYDGTIEFVDAVQLPCFNSEIVENFHKLGLGNFYSHATNTYNVGLCMCSFEHYRILSKAVSMNYKRIMILEDDACFYNDIEAFRRALDTMPDDFNILHLEGIYIAIDEGEEKWISENVLSPTVEESQWAPSTLLGLYGCAGLIYSEEGMKEYLRLQNEYMQFADYYTFILKDKCYFYTYPLIMQEDDTYSNITDVVNCIAEYNTYLHYAKIENYIL